MADKQPPDYNRLAIDATVIAGALIFLTISSVAVIIPSALTNQTDIALLYKTLTAAFAFIIIVPFSVDALGALRSPPGSGKAMAIGFIVIPLLIGLLALSYFLSSYHIIPYIPLPVPPK